MPVRQPSRVLALNRRRRRGNGRGMKIGFLLQDIGVIYGAQRATLDLLRMLAAAGVEAHVALMRETRRTDLPADYRTALAGCATVTEMPVDRAFSPAMARRSCSP